jgi:hypothetical protein
MLVGDQRRFLTIEDERAQLAEREDAYQREASWRKEQSIIAIARWRLRAKPRPAPSQDRPTRVSTAATSLEQRANAMRRKLRLTPARICWGW